MRAMSPTSVRVPSAAAATLRGTMMMSAKALSWMALGWMAGAQTMAATKRAMDVVIVTV